MLLGIDPSISALSPSQIGLTRGQIQEAIEFGRTGMPRPYELRRSDNNPVVVGLVYTPFLRVALLSQFASKRGFALTPDEIGSEVVAPTVNIAFRWYFCCDTSGRGEPIALDPLGPPEPQVLALAEGSSTIPAKARGLSPIRVYKGSRFLGDYGMPVYDDIIVIADFPMSVMKTGQIFLVFRHYPNGDYEHRNGVITAANMAAWR